MIRQLVIKNFRGIKEGTIELSPLTILLGANNSGKSTILEALFLAPNPFRTTPYHTGLYGYDSALITLYYLHQTLDYKGYTFFAHNYTSTLSEIEWEEKDKKYIFKIINIGDNIYFYTNRQSPRPLEVKLGEVTYPCFGNVRSSGLEHTNVLHSDPFSNQTLLLNPSLSRPFFEFLRRNWAPLVNTGIMRKVAEDTSMLSPEKYIDLTMEPFIGGQLELYVYLQDGRRIRLGDLGAGIQSYVMARVLYEYVKPDVLLWDDIESHFNPRILRHLAEWFGDLVNDGRQVIVATHSLEALKVIAGVNEEQTGVNLTLLQNSLLKTKN